MANKGEVNPTFLRHLLIVGNFNGNIEQLSADNSALTALTNVVIERCSLEAFTQHLPPANPQHLIVIITDPSIVLTAQQVAHWNAFFIACNADSFNQVYIPGQQPLSRHFENSLASAVEMGFEFILNKRQIASLSEDIVTVTQERKDLTEIGIALSSEKDLDKLLTMVLQEGRKLGYCEAASLYLLRNVKSDKPELLFKLTQNSKIDFDFKEKYFALTKQSLAGYVALTGEVLNIADAYELENDLPYQFDKSFDNATSYRTRQLLVMPMRNHKGKIIGVLQFINSIDKHNKASEINGFSEERQELLLSLASQAAVAIDNSQLIENIQSLFEGFVAASVKAIESRDPVTSGHSFRVAEFTTGLAECLDKSNQGLYRDTFFSKEQMREIRYASLLHDFGKVGVKENVLLKENKLHASRYQYVELKIEWQRQMVQRKFYQQLLMSKDPQMLKDWQRSPEYLKMQQTLERLTRYKKVLMKANQPSLLDSEVAEELKQLFYFKMDETFPFGRTLLNEKDFLSLSVTRGSLTAEERLEIQSHVVHTQEFLSQIPWTDELGTIPNIAASHHEKLDGSGYPRGLVNKEIPIASKIMAVADIYDALTASDRPYKKAVKPDLALDILKDEAKNGKLCATMVNSFIEGKVFQKV